MGKVPITRLSLDQAGVPRFLQGKTRFVERSQERVLRMDFVRTFDRARSRHRDGVLVHRASFRNDQIVPPLIVPLAFVEVRPLGQAKRSSNKNQLRFAGQRATLRVKFLKQNPGERVAPLPIVAPHVKQPFPPGPAEFRAIMEQRRIESAGIEKNWL